MLNFLRKLNRAQLLWKLGVSLKYCATPQICHLFSLCDYCDYIICSTIKELRLTCKRSYLVAIFLLPKAWINVYVLPSEIRAMTDYFDRLRL